MDSQSLISQVPTVLNSMHDPTDNIRLSGFDYLTCEDPLPAVVDTASGYLLSDGTKCTFVVHETTDDK